MVLNRIFFLASATCALSIFSTVSLAWGPDGHSTIGILALDQLRPDARRELETIINPLNEQALGEACNWPDKMRDYEEWDWAAPQHYINIPRGESSYRQSRDCPGQLCATQAIKRYAAEMGNRLADREMRQQAFNWLCHLVGDLNQPLHAGFADDRGGNQFAIVFKGEEKNLHGFWDYEIISEHAGSWQNMVGLLSNSPRVEAGADWTPAMVDDWTSESHQLAKSIYPAKPDIESGYELQSWEIVQQQIRLAASRLALIINTELKTND